MQVFSSTAWSANQSDERCEDSEDISIDDGGDGDGDDDDDDSYYFGAKEIVAGVQLHSLECQSIGRTMRGQ